MAQWDAARQEWCFHPAGITRSSWSWQKWQNNILCAAERRKEKKKDQLYLVFNVSFFHVQCREITPLFFLPFVCIKMLFLYSAICSATTCVIWHLLSFVCLCCFFCSSGVFWSLNSSSDKQALNNADTLSAFKIKMLQPATNERLLVQMEIMSGAEKPRKKGTRVPKQPPTDISI